MRSSKLFYGEISILGSSIMRRIMMWDYVKRLLIVILVGICVGLLFIGGKNPSATDIETNSSADINKSTNF